MPGGLQFLNLLLEFATVITNQKEKTKTEEATKTKSHRFIKLNQIFAKVIHRYEYRAKKNANFDVGNLFFKFMNDAVFEKNYRKRKKSQRY